MSPRRAFTAVENALGEFVDGSSIFPFLSCAKPRPVGSFSVHAGEVFAADHGHGYVGLLFLAANPTHPSKGVGPDPAVQIRRYPFAGNFANETLCYLLFKPASLTCFKFRFLFIQK